MTPMIPPVIENVFLVLDQIVTSYSQFLSSKRLVKPKKKCVFFCKNKAEINFHSNFYLLMISSEVIFRLCSNGVLECLWFIVWKLFADWNQPNDAIGQGKNINQMFRISCDSYAEEEGGREYKLHIKCIILLLIICCVYLLMMPRILMKSPYLK